MPTHLKSSVVTAVLVVGVLATSNAFALKGDVTGDGQVLSNDIICTARMVADLSLEGTACVMHSHADMDCNGSVNTSDIIHVARHSLGLGYHASQDSNGDGVHDGCEKAPPAFPGAQGHGSASSGGRSGVVLTVTSLEDNYNNPAPGTLRWATSQPGPRTVVFRVAGTIFLQNRLDITEPYITIAGQTAPSPGITIAMDPNSTLGSSTLLQARTNDVIIRYLRLRRGTAKGTGDSLGMYDGAQRVIVDHISASWGTDENIDISARTEDAMVRDITVQRSLIAETMWDTTKSTSPASKGFLISGKNQTNYWRQVQNITVAHNVMAHHTHRNPRVAAKGARIVNNIVYNWFTRVGSTFKDVAVDWDSNLFKAGPMSTQQHVLFHATTEWDQSVTYNEASGYPPPSIYIHGNRLPGYTGEDATLLEANNWLMIHDHYFGGLLDESYRRHEPLPEGTFPVHAVSATDSFYAHRLATVGANAQLACDGRFTPARDSIDTRIIGDVLAGTGISKSGQVITSPSQGGGYPADVIVSNCTDNDADGMPQVWETAHGYSDNDPTNASKDTDSDGYTNIEEYLNGTHPNLQDNEQSLRTVTLGDESVGGVLLSSSPAPVRCGVTCRHWRYHAGQVVTVRAVPIVGDNDVQWTLGPCAGQSDATCQFTVDQDMVIDVQAEAGPSFNKLNWKVTPESTGGGSVVAQTNTGSCGAQCIAVPEGESVTVLAVPAKNAVFSKWTFGKCSKAPNDPSNPMCTISNMPPAALIKVEFLNKP